MNSSLPRPRLRIALQGFSGFERSALASYFRLAGDRYPAYEQCDDPVQAAFIVADADDPAATMRVVDEGRVGDTVFIGAQAPEDALAWMMRPIDPLHVLRELDGAVAMRQAGAAGAAGASREMGGGMSMPTRRACDTPEPARNVPPQVLIVDADDLAARMLERQMSALGLSAARAAGAAKALELLERLWFRFVFIDVELGPQSDIDGLHLCQQIRRMTGPSGEPAPAVFLLTGREVTVDRVRAALAGGDAFVNKPLDEATVRRLLGSHGARFTRQGAGRSLQR